MNHTGTVQLETERLILRRVTIDDAEGVFQYASDPRVTEFLTWPTHRTVDDSRAIIHMWLNDYPKPDFYHWGIIPKDKGQLVGCISAVNVHEENESVEIGYSLAYDCWGRGYMPEALNALINFFFDTVGCMRIEAIHNTENEKSGRVMRKCGMRFEGIERGFARGRQNGCNIAHYAILKKDHHKDIWDTLLDYARSVHHDRAISSSIDAGGVAAAILSKSGRIYTGVCIDTACSLGMCAERNALSSMITAGESRVDKVVAIMGDGKAGMPCGACQEFMMQLGAGSGDIEILADIDTKRTVRLRELMPVWWGESYHA